MEKKGLCNTCVSDKDCSFSRKFPVLQCEEFNDRDSGVELTRRKATRCKKN